MESSARIADPPAATSGSVSPGSAVPAARGLLTWTGYPWLVLAASLLVQASASFGNQAISPLAPFLVDDLHLSRQQIGLLVTATYLGASVVLILAGSLSDRFGVRALFLLGMLGAGLPLTLASTMPGYTWLLLPMALYGLGNGFALPPTTRAIVEWFPTRRRGLAMGIKQTGVALAGVICGLAVPALAHAVGWRGTLVVLGGTTALAGVAAWLAYRDRPHEPAAPGGAPRPGLGAVLRNRNVLLLGGVTLLSAGVQLSLSGFLVLFLRDRVGIGVTEAGALLALTQAGGVVGRIGWGLASDTLFGGRHRIVMMIIGVLAAVSSLVLSLAGPSTSMLALGVTLALAGTSAVGWNGINMTFVAELAGQQASATAAGLSLTASYVGIMIFPPIFGALIDASGGSYTLAFRIGAVASLLTLVLLWRIHPPAPSDEA
ncbi:MAG: MFS transporter [Chloroflexi bacterium]|nr:MFS transporter [Chloroflexota bacterium]